MSIAIERDHLADLSNAVAAYLNLMTVTAECLEQTFPDVGGPYRQRIERLRWRVAYDATREAIMDSSQTVHAELKDYSIVANRVLTQRSVELERGILALSDIIQNLTGLQESYGDQLGKVAAQIASSPYPADAQSHSEAAARQAASVRSLVDGMSREAASIATRMRQETMELDHRLAGTACTDPVTGLINRRELNRQIEAHTLYGATFSLLLFELSGPISDQVLRAAAARLTEAFRHSDRVARWGGKEFAVLFLGGPEVAQMRAAQVVPSMEGRYTLENGETVLIAVQARLMQAELAAA